MTVQNQVVPVSSFQYWLYRLKTLPTPILITLNVFFVAVIVYFMPKPSILIEEWYPGSTKVWPTVQAATSLPALPTAALPSPVPVVQSHPVSGVYVPVQAEPVVEPVPTTELKPTTPPTALPTANEATVQAWLAAPPSTPTALPAPGEPGFVTSFQDGPECNVFIGYVGPKRTYCAAIYASQTSEAEQ
jgi:hypothetical protein